MAWVTGWAMSDWPAAFDVAGLAEPVFFALTLYLLLAFPMGRFEPPATRWLFVAQIAALLIAFSVLVLFSPMITGGGVLAACIPGCPENLLQIASDPSLVKATGRTGVALTLAILVIVMLVYLHGCERRPRPSGER